MLLFACERSPKLKAKRSKRSVAAHGRAMHAAPVRQRVIFADGAMLCGDVVPDKQIADAPLVAVCEFRARDLRIPLS